MDLVSLIILEELIAITTETAFKFEQILSITPLGIDAFNLHMEYFLMTFTYENHRLIFE